MVLVRFGTNTPSDWFETYSNPVRFRFESNYSQGYPSVDKKLMLMQTNKNKKKISENLHQSTRQPLERDVNR